MPKNSSNYHNTVIALGDVKAAMLYFDYVIPVDTILPLFENLPEDWEIVKNGELNLPDPPFDRDASLPTSLKGNYKFGNKFQKLSVKYAMVRYKALKEEEGDFDVISGINRKQHGNLERDFQLSLKRFVDYFHLSAVPIDMSTPGNISAEYDASNISLKLSSLALIDTESCPWDAIMELRQDKRSHSTLRRLRLFMHENYQGQSDSFIADDIERRIEEYTAIASSWGLKTAKGAISSIVTSKSSAGTVLASLGALTAGSPTISAAIAIGGATLQLGKIGLEVAQEALDFRNLMRENPASFVHYARDRLNNTD